MGQKLYDLVGIGVGPFNLSLAALLHPVKQVNSLFLEAKETFSWHPGLLFPNSNLQVSYLKDLVTLVDPMSPYSFLNFLKRHNRFYTHLNAKFETPRRWEFEQYLQWVCNSVDNICFDSKVKKVEFHEPYFHIFYQDKFVKSRHIVIGTGLAPNIPSFHLPSSQKTMFHASRFLEIKPDLKGRRAIVVGGGQTGAEIVNDILSSNDALPESLCWLTRRSHLAPLDDSPFANDWFTPNYVEQFFLKERDVKKILLNQHKLASDGINDELLRDLYQRWYQLKFRDGWKGLEIHTNTQVNKIEKEEDQWNVSYYNILEKNQSSRLVDYVILSTGYRWEFPTYLKSLQEYISSTEDGHLQTNEDYSVQWDYTDKAKIYIQNGSRHCRGVADANLSLMAWRSAMIVNSLCGQEIYPLHSSSKERAHQHPVLEPIV